MRVRLGKVANSLPPGPHIRIPFVDEIILVNTRLRIEATPTVTIAGKAGKARVLTAQVGYSVIDPVRAMLRYTHPSPALIAYAQSKIAEGATPELVRDALNLEFSQHGITVDYVYYTEDVEVRTYRFLNSMGGVYSGGPMGLGMEMAKGVREY